MSVMCANCRSMREPGTEYVAYGGVCWCDEACVAEYYVENETRFRRSGKKPGDIEQAIEHRTVPSSGAATDEVVEKANDLADAFQIAFEGAFEHDYDRSEIKEQIENEVDGVEIEVEDEGDDE